MARQGKELKSMDFEKSADTKIVERVLAECEVGQLITYDALSKAIGRNVRLHAVSSLATARKALLKDGIVFGVERNLGLRRLDDSSIVRSIEKDRVHLHRTASKSLKKLAVVAFSSLSTEDQRSHIATSAQMGAVAMFSNKNATKKIEAKVTVDSGSLSIGETLKLFGG